MLVSQTQEIMLSSSWPSVYFFCFQLSVSLTLLKNKWELFCSTSYHHLIIYPLAVLFLPITFGQIFFLLSVILFLRRKLIGRLPKPHLLKSQILVTTGSCNYFFDEMVN